MMGIADVVDGIRIAVVAVESLGLAAVAEDKAILKTQHRAAAFDPFINAETAEL